MRKAEEIKNRLDELFSSDVPSPDVIDVNPVSQARLFQTAPVDTVSKIEVLDDQNSLSIIGISVNLIREIDRKLIEKPSIPELLEWSANHLINFVHFPEHCTFAITYQDLIFGNKTAIAWRNKSVIDLYSGSEIYGHIHLGYFSERTISTEETGVLEVAAGRIAGYIENQFLEQRMKRRTHELSVLNEMSRTLTSMLNTQEIAEFIYQYTAKLMEVVDFFVAYYDDQSQIIDFTVLHLKGVEVEPFKRPLGQGLTDYIIRNKKPLLLKDNVVEQIKKMGLEHITVGDDKPAASWLGVPILYEEKILGVISVQGADQPGLYSENERDLLQAIAQQAAVAIQNAKSINQIREAEALTAQRAADLESVAQLSTSISSIFDPEKLLQVVCDLSKMMFGLYHAHIYLINDTKTDLVLSAGAGEAGKLMVSQGWKISIQNEHSIVARSVREKLGVRIDDVREVIDFLPSPLLPNTRSELAVPLLVGENILGVLDVQADQVNRFSQEDINIQTSLAAQIAVALQNARNYQETQLALSQMEELQRMLSRQAWSSYLNRQEREHWGYEYNRIDVKPIKRQPEERIPDIPTNFESPIESYTKNDAFETSIEVRGEMIGRLGVQEDISILSEEEQSFLHAVADQVAQALERARLIEETQKGAVELQTVSQVSSASTSNLDPNELLQSVVDLAKNSFGLYHSHLYLVDESETKLILSAGAGDIGRQMVDEGWSILMGEESIVARAARGRIGQIVNNVREDPNFLPNPLLPKTASELAVPMIVGKKLLGVFDVQSDRLNAFTMDDQQTYMTLATQTAVALQNARLFAEQTVTVERLRELDHLKTSFLANMSHELRTPLNSILGFSQVILEGIDGPLTDYMISDLQLIEKNGKHLLNLINEVLDMAKIEAGRMSLTLESVDLRELLEDVLETTSAQAREKAIFLNLDADRGDDLVIYGDQMRLRQIMLNLVSNAIKFTDSGGVTVNLCKQGDNISILVKDTGIGIPDDKLESIFEAFSQVDTSTTRKAGGTGLGLPISRRLVEMHGGKLWAESNGAKAGTGTVMHMTIPIDARTV
jgi:signal transduction histidine kinase